MSPAVLTRILAMGLAIVMTACGSATTDVPSSFPTPSVAAAASAAAAPTFAPTPGPPTRSVEPSPSITTRYPYPVGTTIQIVADGVRVRSAAGVGADSVGVLERDVRATVAGGPAEADGYTWYEIESPAASGWVATGDAEHRWIVAVPGLTRPDLVFRFRPACDVTPPLIAPALTVTADRQVVITSPDTGGWLAGRLTDAAFSEFSALIARPELAQSGEYWPERRPGADEPPGHGLCVFRFTLGPPDDRIDVTSVSWFGDEEESTYYLPAPERRSLDELARRLSGAAFIPDSAWSDPPAEYRAATHLVWLWDLGSPTAGAPSLDELSVLEGGETFGEPIGSGRCGYLERSEAEELAAAFAESRTPLDLATVSYLTVASESGWATMVTSPMTPDGFPTCGDIPG